MRFNISFSHICVFAFGASLLFAGEIAADDVKLVHGKLYRNVRTRMSENFVSIRFRHGGRIVVPKKSIAWLINRPHKWAPTKKKPKALVEQPAKAPLVAAAREKPNQPGTVKNREKQSSIFASCGFKSVMAPGWGQYACGSTKTGHGIVASLLLTGYGMFALRQNHRAASGAMTTNRVAALALPRRTFLVPVGYWAYDRSLRLQERREQAADSYRRLSIAMLLMYGLQIAHAFTLDGGTSMAPAGGVGDAKNVGSLRLELAADYSGDGTAHRHKKIKASFRFRF